MVYQSKRELYRILRINFTQAYEEVPTEFNDKTTLKSLGVLDETSLLRDWWCELTARELNLSKDQIPKSLREGNCPLSKIISDFKAI